MRVFIVEDHALVREALAEWLNLQAEVEVVGTSESAEEAIDAVRDLRPDIVLMDIHLPEMSGIQSIQSLASKCPDAKIVLITGDTDEATLYDAINAGASGFLLKTIHPEQVLRALKDVMAGNFALDPTVVGKVARWAVLGARTTLHLGDSPLSEREREVAELAVRGFTNQQIADRLFISPETVKTHIRNISRKLGVNNKKELRAWLRGELRTPPSGS